MTVGYELRQARQQAGLSREEISQSTKIQLAKLEALEENAFERLPEGIYLDGIVRAYARAVGLDGDLIVQRTRLAMAISERESALAPPEWTQRPPAREVVYSSEGPVDADLELFPTETDVAYDHGAPGVREVHDSRALRFDAVPDVRLTPPAPRRGSALLALMVVVLLTAFGVGGFLYESSRRSAHATDNPNAQRASGAPGTSGAPGRASTRAGPTEGGSQEAQGTAVTPDTRARREQASASPVAPATGQSPESAASAPAASVASPVDARQAARVPQEPTASGALPEPAVPAAPAPALPAPPARPALPGLSGQWTLDTRIESSSYRDYHGLQLGYQLDLRQDGSRVSGTGVKTTENGRRLSSTAQTPIEFEGTLDGQRLTLAFIERGLLRPSTGKMILEVHQDGVLRGRFSSTAAQSGGLVEARRPGG